MYQKIISKKKFGLGKGYNPKSETLDPCKIFDWIQKFWPQVSISVHLMLISSLIDKIFRLLKFSGNKVTSPTCHFPIQNSYSKIFFDLIDLFVFVNQFSDYLQHILRYI